MIGVDLGFWVYGFDVVYRFGVQYYYLSSVGVFWYQRLILGIKCILKYLREHFWVYGVVFF